MRRSNGRSMYDKRENNKSLFDSKEYNCSDDSVPITITNAKIHAEKPIIE